jgi:16S rRNA (adenine1518-N6/adenine1519-N6)-dimethyltransferase
MKAFAPKRRFSQNFLTDPGTADKIVGALEITAGDHVLEIGPGTGVLTQRLAASAAMAVIAVDVDPRAVDHVRQAPWSKGGRVDVRERDVLTIDPSEIMPSCDRQHRKVIGNIPYGITSDILFWLFGARKHVGRGVIMMQREVAKRCTATKGTKEYGILAVATWFASEAKLLFTVKPGSFFPAPDVTSAVVRFDLREADPLPVDMEVFMGFVRSAFGQRRKVISNGIDMYCRQRWGRGIRDLVHQGLPVDPTKRRAEELAPDELYALWASLDRRAQEIAA